MPSEHVKGALISAVISAFLGSFLQTIAAFALRPLNQKLEATGFFNAEAHDIISQFGVDIVQKARNGELLAVNGREKEIEELITHLRQRDNPCIVGDAGVGKTALIEGLAVKIADGDVPEDIKDWIIIKVDFPSLIVGKGYGGNSTDGIVRLRALFEYAKHHQNVIIFIDEVHQFSGYADLCKTYLDRKELRFVGATTTAEFNQYLAPDPALARRFSIVYLERPTMEEALNVIQARVPMLEHQYNVHISSNSVSSAVILNERYRPFAASPDREIKTLTMACELACLEAGKQTNEAHTDQEARVVVTERPPAKKDGFFTKVARGIVNLFKRKPKAKPANTNNPTNTNNIDPSSVIEVTENHVRKAVSMVSNIPVENLTDAEKISLLNTAERMKSQMVCQDEAIDRVSRAIIESRLEMNDPSRLRGAFLFAGASGSGKTKLASLIADEIGKSFLINAAQFDSTMREKLLEKIKTDPYCLIVFDDLDKAKPSIIGDIVSTVDRGWTYDNKGQKVSFTNTFVVLTVSTDPKAMTKEETLDSLVSKLGVEYINKINDIIIFNAIDKENAQKITGFYLDQLCQLLFSQYKMKIRYNEDLIDLISTNVIKAGTAGRGITNYVQRDVFQALSQKLATNEIKMDQDIILGVVDGKIDCFVLEEEVIPEVNIPPLISPEKNLYDLDLDKIAESSKDNDPKDNDPKDNTSENELKIAETEDSHDSSLDKEVEEKEISDEQSIDTKKIVDTDIDQNFDIESDHAESNQKAY